MLKKLSLAAGIACLLFAMFPVFLYGILNTGVVELYLVAGFLLFWPQFWPLLPRFARRAASILIIAVAVYYCVTSFFLIRQAYYNPPPNAGNGTVIVLGAKIQGDQPSLMLKRRLDKAFYYLQENPEAICVVTGGQGADEEFPEALVMRHYLMEKGIDSDRVLMEDTSTNTQSNFLNARALTPGDCAFVVVATDGFHQLRASVFAKAAFPGLPVYSISSLTPWGLLPSYWLRDLNGVPIACWQAGMLA